jgi:hypothetical protein
MLCKIAGLVRDLRPRLAERIAEALKTPLSGSNSLMDVNDRYYLASFWRYSPQSWTVDVLATWMVQEEAGESVRKECAVGLITTARNYAEAITALSHSLNAFEFQTESPSNSKAKRFRRCIAAIREAIAKSPKDEPGPSFGQAIRDLVRSTFTTLGLPKRQGLTENAAKEVIELLLVVVRRRVSAALEGDLYSVLFSLRDWFDQTSWVELTNGELLFSVSKDIADCLEYSLRSGRPDKELLSVLLLACGTQERYSAHLERLTAQNLGLSEELIAWLYGRSIARRTPLSEESQMTRMEISIAELMLAIEEANILKREVERTLLPNLSIFASLPDQALRKLMESTSQLKTLVDGVAAERQLTIFGKIDTVLKYSPLEHEFENPSELGHLNVRIVRAGVIATSLDGRSRVVKKALVRKVEE